MAWQRRRPAPGLVHHRDPGKPVSGHTLPNGVGPARGRRQHESHGHCYDNNAPVERCFSSLKNELVRHRQFQNQAEARQAVVASVEECSTRQRLHQALGYRSPAEFEQMAGESSSRWPLFPSHLSPCHHTVAVRHLFRA